MTIAVAAEALTADATRWDEIGDAIDEAKTAAYSLDLHRGAFSWAGTAAADTYATLLTQVTTLLTEGSTQTHGAATALRAVRSDWESTEADIQAEVGSLWQPK